MLLQGLGRRNVLPVHRLPRLEHNHVGRQHHRQAHLLSIAAQAVEVAQAPVVVVYPGANLHRWTMSR